MSDEPKILPPRSLQEVVGALLFASETPLSAADLREALRHTAGEEGENEVLDVYRTSTAREIESALKGLAKALEVANCGFVLSCVNGTYRYETQPSCGRFVRSLLKLDRPSRLSRASLETLAIIAYRQPLTKSEIEAIRGVDVSGNLKTLVELGLVRLVGKSELPGHPFLYGTTPFFLEHFGLASLSELNELDPTLQRSNPRLKAATYKKPVAEATEEAAEAEPATTEESESTLASPEAGEDEEEPTSTEAEEGDFLAVENVGEEESLAAEDEDADEDEDEDEEEEEDDEEDEDEDDEDEDDEDVEDEE